MGRSAGWIAAGATLAKRRDPNAAPSNLPTEIAFSLRNLFQTFKDFAKKEKYCVVVVGEGLVDSDGNYVSTDSASSDAFGHSQLGGAGEYLRS